MNALAGTMIFFMGVNYPAGWTACTPKETAALTAQYAVQFPKLKLTWSGAHCIIKLPRPQ